MARLDPICHAPASELPGFVWPDDPTIIAMEIAASVMRRLRGQHGEFAAFKGGFQVDLRNALDREISAALNRKEPA